MPVADLLPELILLIGAAAIVVAASFLPHRLHWLCAIATIVLLGVSFGVVLSRWDNAAQLTFSGVWALDGGARFAKPVSYTHLRAHETDSYLVCRLLLE